jgi:hypothetical protein
MVKAVYLLLIIVRFSHNELATKLLSKIEFYNNYLLIFANKLICDVKVSIICSKKGGGEVLFFA